MIRFNSSTIVVHHSDYASQSETISISFPYHIFDHHQEVIDIYDTGHYSVIDQ